MNSVTTLEKHRKLPSEISLFLYERNLLFFTNNESNVRTVWQCKLDEHQAFPRARAPVEKMIKSL